MMEAAIFLFQHAGFLALMLLFGVLIDRISTPLLKADIHRWITTPYKLDFSESNVRYFLRSFLDGILHRVFGRNIFSWNFFLRTCIVSVIFFSAAVAIQLFLYPKDTFSQFKMFSLRPLEASIYFVALFILNFMVDYFSNITTISLLRMAARSGRIFDTLLVFLADVTLTITVFTLVYPAGILFDLVINQSLNRTFAATAREGSQITKLAYEDQFKTKLPALDRYSGEMEIRVLFFRDGSETEVGYSASSYVVVLYPKHKPLIDLVESYAEIMKAFGSLEKHEVTENKGKIILKATLAHQTLSANFIGKLYYAAYLNSNIMRDSLFDLMRLQPTTVSFSRMYGDYAYHVNVTIGGKDSAAYKCTKKVVVSDEIEEWTTEFSIAPLAEVITNLNTCPLDFLVLNIDSVDFWWDMQALSASEENLPITPFFFTSFASSILYYAIIILFALGAISFKALQRIYKTPYLNTKEMPLTIVMLLAMFPIFVLEFLISLLR